MGCPESSGIAGRNPPEYVAALLRNQCPESAEYAMSMANVIYGSFATPVVALLSIEVVAIILLLGAQVIAELESEGGKSARGNDRILKPDPEGDWIL
jgi:hypothetical protein